MLLLSSIHSCKERKIIYNSYISEERRETPLINIIFTFSAILLFSHYLFDSAMKGHSTYLVREYVIYESWSFLSLHYYTMLLYYIIMHVLCYVHVHEMTEPLHDITG